MNQPTRVLISGAGIAGPALAYWLDRYGYDVTVVEIAAELRPGGQTVDLRGAGRMVIERMGLMPAARAVTIDQQGIAWVDGKGRRTAVMPADAFGGEGIISEVEILRGDLAGLLHEATADRVRYRFGTSITSLEQGPDGVRVTLSDQSVELFDLVIGADGPHSATRRLAFGPEDDYVHHLGGYNAWFTAPDPVGLDGWAEMYVTPGRNVLIRPDRKPGLAKASMAFRSDRIEYRRSDIAAQRDAVLGRFVDSGWHVPVLLDAVRTADDFYFDALVQLRMPSWSVGRVAVVGDAGYCPSPLSGLGTSLGLVGAYILAGELSRADGDHRQAFARYQTRLRPYVSQGQKLAGGGVKGYAPNSELAIRMGAFATRLMVSRVGSGLARRLFFSKADAIDLPQY